LTSPAGIDQERHGALYWWLHNADEAPKTPGLSILIAMLENYLYIIRGDITQLRADAISYFTGKMFRGDGQLYASFRDRLPGFAQKCKELSKVEGSRNLGDSHWVALDGDHPKGVIVTISIERGIDCRSLVGKTVESSIEMAVQKLPVPSSGERLLVALPCF
jgi:hypothetical protein